MTRIVAGTAGGRRLQTPSGGRTRPTTDRVREAMFSALESAKGPLHGLRFLDLFAGSGAVGLEALSRGASEAVLVEQDRRAAALIQRNATVLGLPAVSVSAQPVAHHLRTMPASLFDVVFADPPYSLGNEELVEVLELLVNGKWLTADAVVILERSSRDPAPRWPSGMLGTRHRRYGDTVLWYGLRSSSDPASPEVAHT